MTDIKLTSLLAGKYSSDDLQNPSQSLIILVPGIVLKTVVIEVCGKGGSFLTSVLFHNCIIHSELHGTTTSPHFR